MNKPEFLLQMQLLEKAFERNYTEERLESIYSSLKFESIYLFKDAIAHCISSLRAMPLLPELRDAIALQRERATRKEKEVRREDFKSLLSDDESSLMFKSIVDRIDGKMPDNKWNDFKKVVNDTCGRLAAPDCITCNDTGLVFASLEGNSYAFRCKCKAGKNRQERYPVYSEHGYAEFKVN